MDFKAYLDVEALHKEDCEGLLLGTCYIFPKIDGTNASIWMEGGEICGGSRTRRLVPEKDNFDFLTGYIRNNEEKLKKFFESTNGLRLYGEYLVPHTLRTYRDEAWKKFYVFDVVNEATGEFIPYENYKLFLDLAQLDYIPCITKIENPSMEQLGRLRDSSTYLVKDGQGLGEGIVIKQYNWRNKFGHRVYGKLVRNEFKESNQRAFPVNELAGEKQVEIDIAADYVTEGRINKMLAKMSEDGRFTSKRIPELLSKVYYDIITEEMWDILKKYKNPAINFRKLNMCVVNKIKDVRKELF